MDKPSIDPARFAAACQRVLAAIPEADKQNWASAMSHLMWNAIEMKDAQNALQYFEKLADKLGEDESPVWLRASVVSAMGKLHDLIKDETRPSPDDQRAAA